MIEFFSPLFPTRYLYLETKVAIKSTSRPQQFDPDLCPFFLDAASPAALIYLSTSRPRTRQNELRCRPSHLALAWKLLGKAGPSSLIGRAWQIADIMKWRDFIHNQIPFLEHYYVTFTDVPSALFPNLCRRRFTRVPDPLFTTQSAALVGVPHPPSLPSQESVESESPD